jgi:hypothetical protein
MNKSPVRRLFWDLEVSPNVVLSWRTGYKLSISPENILEERAVICASYKWEGDDKVHSLRWDRQHSDAKLLKELLKVVACADELVAHNGDKFDLPWLRARCLKHGLQPLPNYKTVDTLAWARRLFRFNSNKLDYIAQFLGVGAKTSTEFGLWRRVVVDRDRGALDEMVRYCAQDVRILEGVWDRLRIAAAPKTHAGVLKGSDRWSCPHCGSEKVGRWRIRSTAAGSVQHQMRCRSCKAFYSIGEPAWARLQKARD